MRTAATMARSDRGPGQPVSPVPVDDEGRSRRKPEIRSELHLPRDDGGDLRSGGLVRQRVPRGFIRHDAELRRQRERLTPVRGARRGENGLVQAVSRVVAVPFEHRLLHPRGLERAGREDRVVDERQANAGIVRHKSIDLATRGAAIRAAIVEELVDRDVRHAGADRDDAAQKRWIERGGDAEVRHDVAGIGLQREELAEPLGAHRHDGPGREPRRRQPEGKENTTTRQHDPSDSPASLAASLLGNMSGSC